MAKSIRISNQIYKQARTESKLVKRSVGQQVEYWVHLGQIFEAQCDSKFEEIQLILKNQKDRDKQRIESGEIDQSALFAISDQWVFESVDNINDINIDPDDTKEAYG